MLFPGAAVLRRSPARRDFHEAYNDAVRRCGTPFLAFVDSDVFWLDPARVAARRREARESKGRRRFLRLASAHGQPWHVRRRPETGPISQGARDPSRRVLPCRRRRGPIGPAREMDRARHGRSPDARRSCGRPRSRAPQARWRGGRVRTLRRHHPLAPRFLLDRRGGARDDGEAERLLLARLDRKPRAQAPSRRPLPGRSALRLSIPANGRARAHFSASPGKTRDRLAYLRRLRRQTSAVRAFIRGV